MRRLYTILTLALLVLCSVGCKDDASSSSTSAGSITLTGMVLDCETLDMYSGMDYTLTATYTPSDANALSLEWTSSDTSVATVYDGKVVAVASGVATITLTNDISYEDEDGNVYDEDKTVTASCVVTVDPLMTFTLSTIPDDITEIYSNYWSLTDSGAPSTSDFAALRDITYDSGRSFKLEFPNIEEFPASALKFVEQDEDETTTTTDDDEDDDDEDDEIVSTLTSIKAPVAKIIGEEAFYNCTSLIEVDFSSVETVGPYAFAYCELLPSIDMPLLTEIPTGLFYACSKLTSADFPLVESLESNAFYSCRKLASAELPMVTSIPEDTFSWCESLVSINAPEVTSVGAWSFGGCKVLTSVDMPLATTIGDYAFYNNLNLTTVNFAAAQTLGDNVFYACTSISDLTLATTSSSLSVESTSFGSNTGLIHTRTAVDLTTGSGNGATINGNYITIGTNTFEFKSITVE